MGLGPLIGGPNLKSTGISNLRSRSIRRLKLPMDDLDPTSMRSPIHSSHRCNGAGGVRLPTHYAIDVEEATDLHGRSYMSAAVGPHDDV
ncbi:hypothetical protein CRG98_035734 [Punica granatum]|uniref:Uncharacterized protein n=1 Tax=Punica granatum TaxID=22663 RepID=A0A2I0IJN6_PUNGR|nr:hypothetical protein CRG98_035734 [Punica granatum]